MSLFTPPDSMWFIILLSTAIAIVSAILTKLLVDTEELQRKQLQIKAHNEEKKKIIDMAEVDIERYRKQRKKWERREVMLKKSQQGMAMQRLKPNLITMLPMLILFFVLRTFFEDNPVAATPMNPDLYGLLSFFVGMALANKHKWFGGATWLSFTGWYFICSLGINTIIQRLLKMQTQASGGMEQMFGGQKSAALQFPDV